MPKISPPPIQNQLSEEGTGFPTLPWILFFNSIFTGDTGTNFTSVTYANLTVVGTPVITGTYYRIGQFIRFAIVIDPQGGNTSAVAGTTYFNLPFDVLVDDACFAVSGLLGTVTGMIDSTTNRCYPPAWTTVTVPLTITGMCRAS